MIADNKLVYNVENINYGVIPDNKCAHPFDGRKLMDLRELIIKKEKKQLTHLSLFSGVGGLDLAAEWAGFTTVGQCEFADYPYEVLCKHWTDVPKWRDIRDLTGGSFYEWTGLRTVDIISGGFPCQPFSIVGKRKGKEDDRYLWPEMLRVIKELHPNWVVGENVVGFVNMGFDDALSDLEGEGYETRTFVIPACAVGASFKGERVFILASSNGKRWDCMDKKQKGLPNVKYSEILAKWRNEQDNLLLDFPRTISKTGSGKERNDDGISEGVDRLKCLGNAVVPQQVYQIFKGIYDIENMR